MSPGSARGARVALPVVGLLLVGWIDYMTGPMLAFFPFYLCVLVLAGLRHRVGVTLLYAVLAAVIYLVVDLLTTPAVARTPHPYWRATAQLLNFGLVGYIIPTLIGERRRLMQSESALVRQQAELHALSGRLVAALEEVSVARRSSGDGSPACSAEPAAAPREASALVDRSRASA
jgi:hypothetical protein